MIESGEVEGEMSNIFFFLPSITDRSEDINKYLNNVDRHHLATVEQLGQNSFWSRIDTYGLEKNTMNDAVINCLKHMNDISNSNIVRNAYGLFSRKEVDAPVAWVVEHKQRLLPQKFQVSYWFLL